MKKTLTATVFGLSMAMNTSYAAQIFFDDFETYAVSNPASDPLDADLFDPNNVTWTPSSNAADAHRIFDTAGNFGGTRLWISNINGTSLTSSGIALQNDMTYTVDFFAASETFDGNRKLDFTADILVGADIGSATSVLGGGTALVASGDNLVTDDDKSDHLFQVSFDSGTITPGDEMFIRFTRVGVNSGTGSWFGIDDVSLDESRTVPEPSSSALVALGLAGLAFRRRR